MSSASFGVLKFDLLVRRGLLMDLLESIRFDGGESDEISICAVRAPGDDEPWYHVWTPDGGLSVEMLMEFWGIFYFEVKDKDRMLAGRIRVDLCDDDGVAKTVVSEGGRYVPITLMYDCERPIVDEVLESTPMDPNRGWLEQLSEVATLSDVWLKKHGLIIDIDMYGQSGPTFVLHLGHEIKDIVSGNLKLPE